MRLLNYDSVIIQERQRKSISRKELNELAESIERYGILHPPVLRNDNDQWLLVSGERRYHAMKQLDTEGKRFVVEGGTVPQNLFPYLLITDLDEVTAKEVELEENLRRVNLTWQEEVEAISALDKLRKQQNPGYSKSDLASEIATSRSQTQAGARAQVTKALAVAAKMDNPDVKRSTSLREAYQKILKEDEQEFSRILSKRSEAAKQDGQKDYNLLEGDAFELLPRLPDSFFSCVVTDPPYGINANEFGDAASRAHQYDDTKEYAIDIINLLARELKRVTKPEAHVFVFCAHELFNTLHDAFNDYDFWCWPTPIIWDKGSIGHVPHPDHGPRRVYETIFYAIKGLKKIRESFFDIIKDCPPPRERFHAAQKPTELYKRLLKISCLPGDHILDPFSGSGTVFHAARLLNLHATGIEKDTRMVEYCHTTLAGEHEAAVEEL